MEVTLYHRLKSYVRLGPAPDSVTQKIYEASKSIQEYSIVPNVSVQ
jgi:hypothetical protein